MGEDLLVKLQYLGQCGFLMEAPGVRIVTDPYLSYALDRNATDRQPWHRAYPPPCTLAALAPDAVVISHAHPDHLDKETLAPYFAQGGGAPVIVPAPVLPFAKAFAPSACAAKAEQALRFQNAEIIPIPCAHTQLRQDENGDYTALSYLIVLEGRRIFFGGDMSMYDGLAVHIRALEPDVLLLPANGADYFRTADGIIGNLSCIEAAKLTASCGLREYIPMHHDLYPFNGCRVSWILDSARDAGVAARVLACGETIEL